MKKTKFAVFFTALMVMLGLSSCLGEPDPYNTVTEVMKVNNYLGLYSFKSAAGYTVQPTNSEDLSSSSSSLTSSYAYVSYKYDTRTISSTTSTIQAEILYLLPINDITPSYYATEANAPMYAVSSSLKFYDKTNIFVDLTYYYKSATNDELKEELAKHDFVIYRDTEDEDANDDTVVLVFTHEVSDPENDSERTKLGTETRHFDLTSVLYGNEPEKIIIKFKQNQSSASLDDKNTKDSEITIDYKKIVDQYFSSSTSSN